MATRDAAGGTSPVRQVEVPLNIPRKEVLNALGQYYLYTLTLKMKPGVQHVAVAVRDELAAATSYLSRSVTVGEAARPAVERDSDRRQHDLAEGAPPLERLVGLGGALQREDAVDHRPEPAVAQARQGEGGEVGRQPAPSPRAGRARSTEPITCSRRLMMKPRSTSALWPPTVPTTTSRPRGASAARWPPISGPAV